MKLTTGLKSLAGVLLALTTTVATARADVIVVQSNAPGLQSGSLLKDTAKITIPSGKNATFVLPSGATRTVSGPFNGTGATLTKGVKADRTIFAAVKDYIVTGGTTTKEMGATRGIAAATRAPAGPKTAEFSWHVIPISSTGDICVEKGAKLELGRSQAYQESRYTLIDMRSQLRARVVFLADQKVVPWPDDIDVDPRATYVLKSASRQQNLRLRLIGPLPAREDILRVLHAQRCQSQFRAYLRDMKEQIAMAR